MNELIFNLWDTNESVIGIASNRFGSGHFILSAYHNEAAHTLNMVLDATDERTSFFQNGNMIGFVDMDGLYQLFTICECEITAANASTLSVYAEHVLYELAQEPVLSLNGGASLSYALTQALQDTRWDLGYCVDAGSHAVNKTNTDVLACLKATATAYGVELDYYVTVTNNVITSRNVRAVTRLGTNRGRRFEYTKDTSTIKGKLSISEVKTALIGLGKGSQSDDEDRITFADAEWSISAGDPADKPSGAVFVEDAEAKTQYGFAGGTRNRVGFVTFSSIEDPEELLASTWEALQEKKTPTASYTLTVMDLEKSEGSHEAVRVGDDVLVIHRKIVPPITLSVRVTDVKRDLLSPENTKIQLGDATTAISATIKQAATLAAKASGINENGTIPTDYLQGAIDALANQLVASGSYENANVIEGKGILLENTNPLSPGYGALYLGPGIFSVANTKTGDSWNWRTFGTGAGFTADMVTTGILNAALIKILGSDNFFWDAENIYIKNPEDTGSQIRIGKYDGTHYGIGWTTDGGTTWQNAIGFDGVTLASAVKATGIDIHDNIVSISGATVDISTATFAVKNSSGAVMFSITEENEETGEPGGLLSLGSDGNPIKLNPSIIIPPENGGTGYPSGQTHRVTSPPPDLLGIDGDLSVFYNGESTGYSDITPSAGPGITTTYFGKSRVWNYERITGYNRVGNLSAGDTLNGSFWTFTTPTGGMSSLTLQFQALKYLSGTWYGWNLKLPLTVAVFSGTGSAIALASNTFLPPNNAATISVPLTFATPLAGETTYYIAIYDPQDTLNKSCALVQLSSVIIPGVSSEKTLGIYVRSNGQYVDITAQLAELLGNHMNDSDNPHSVTAEKAGADPSGAAAAVQSSLNTHASNHSNPHAVTALQAGADASGTAAAAVSAHDAATSAHATLFGNKQAKITAAGILKGDGSGGVGAAVGDTDYQRPVAYGTTAPSSPFTGQIWLKPKA